MMKKESISQYLKYADYYLFCEGCGADPKTRTTPMVTALPPEPIALIASPKVLAIQIIENHDPMVDLKIQKGATMPKIVAAIRQRLVDRKGSFQRAGLLDREPGPSPTLGAVPAERLVGTDASAS